MSGDDKRKLGKIQLQRVLVPASPKPDDEPSSSVRRSAPPPAPPPSSGTAVAYVDLTQLVVSAAILELVPRPAAEKQCVLPLACDDARIVVAMANPRDTRVIDEIAFTSGRAVIVKPAEPAALMATIAAAYDAIEKGAQEYRARGKR